MKYSKTIVLVVTFLMTLVFIFGCANASKPEASAPPQSEQAEQQPETLPEQEPEELTVTDMMGRQITVPDNVERVIALTASDCEILYALGAGDTLIGRGEYCNYPAKALEVPSVQSGYETNIEQIIALEPQIVFMNKMDQSEDQVNALTDAGITVVMSDADDIKGTYESIELVGAVMGKNDEAQALIDSMKSAFLEMSENAKKDGEKKTVYFEVSPLEYGLWTAGSATFMNELADILGVENAFGDVEGWVEISEEQVIERNPDYIVTITMYFGEGPSPVEEIMGRSGWENITAVKNGAVLNADSDEISRPGPRLVNAATTLYDFFYTE